MLKQLKEFFFGKPLVETQPPYKMEQPAARAPAPVVEQPKVAKSTTPQVKEKKPRAPKAEKPATTKVKADKPVEKKEPKTRKPKAPKTTT